MRILIYLLVIIAAYYLFRIILRMIIKNQINKYKDRSSTTSQKKYDTGKIEDADYEEIK